MSAVQTSSVSQHVRRWGTGGGFHATIARCWKLAAVDWSYGDESLDLHLYGVLLTGIRLSHGHLDTRCYYLGLHGSADARNWLRQALIPIPANVCPAYQLDHHAVQRVGGGMPFDVCSDVSPPLRTSA